MPWVHFASLSCVISSVVDCIRPNVPRSNMFIFSDQERTGRNLAEYFATRYNLVGARAISPPPGGPNYLAQGLHAAEMIFNQATVHLF
jgi:hypothetical protein